MTQKSLLVLVDNLGKLLLSPFLLYLDHFSFGGSSLADEHLLDETVALDHVFIGGFVFKRRGLAILLNCFCICSFLKHELGFECSD